MKLKHFLRLFTVLCITASFGLIGCGGSSSGSASSTSTATSVSALPQPSVNCDGDSCID